MSIKFVKNGEDGFFIIKYSWSIFSRLRWDSTWNEGCQLLDHEKNYIYAETEKSSVDSCNFVENHNINLWFKEKTEYKFEN